MEIKFENVTYKNIFKNLTFNIRDNEITAIIGKNNSGKTKVLDLICGNSKVDIGSITKKINSNNIFYLTNNFSDQLFNINNFEDICYGVKNIDKKRINELLRMFDLDENILEKNYLEISKSESKKILLISMIISDKNVLILDNPTSSLDYKSKQTLIKLLKQEKRKGKIIVISSFDTDFLLSIADRVIVFENGKIIADGNKYNILQNVQLLKNIYLQIPGIVQFKNKTYINKKINLFNRDNINDLIKDVYRNAR